MYIFYSMQRAGLQMSVSLRNQNDLSQINIFVTDESSKRRPSRVAVTVPSVSPTVGGTVQSK